MVNPTSFQQTRDSIGSEPDKFPIPLRFNKELRIYKLSALYKKFLEDGILYWDSDIQGLWDNFNWGSETDKPTVHPDNILSIVNQNNIFFDSFDTNDYIGSGSDGTFIAGQYDLIVGQTLQSPLIAKDNNKYKDLLIKVNSSNSNYTIKASVNGGTNYESITNEVTKTLSISSIEGVKYRITATGSCSIYSVKIKYS